MTEQENKCKCNVMDLIKTEDTQDDNIIRYYECGECGNTQEDVYKLIDSQHIPKEINKMTEQEHPLMDKLDISSLIELKEWAEKEDIDLNDLLIQIKDNYEEVKEILE